MPLGIVKAAVVNHSRAVGPESDGLPVTFGRSLAPKPSCEMPVLELSLSGSSATVKGRPVWNVRTPKLCQPPSQRWPLKNGRSYA